MRMQIYRVKKPSCKILKTKNCVPFEKQYYSTVFPGLKWIPFFANFSLMLISIEQLECAVDGAPWQVPTLKSFYPKHPKSHPWGMTPAKE